MSDLPNTTNSTPSILSIAAEASSSIPSNDSFSTKARKNVLMYKHKSRDHSSSSSTSSDSSSSSNSVTSLSIHHNDDDDVSSIDDTNDQLTQIQERIHTLRRLLPRDSLSSSEEPPILILPNAECLVCLEELPIRPLSCCSSSVCSSCIYSHLSSHINEAQIRIACPSCPHIFTREELLMLLAEKDDTGEISEKYKRFYADINRQPHIKTCPQCCAIKEVDKTLFEGMRRKKHIPRRVNCDECHFDWCFYCHAPWHQRMTCKEYRAGEKLLREWAFQTDNNQKNAQQCPRCKVFISRNGGCPHMICSKCHCDFCYNCGKRRFAFKFLGSHESRLSPFGCKYNFYPDKPAIRYTVRGLVAGAATLAAPVAAVGAVALLAVGTTIGAPTYGTYRLVKHIRNKRRARRFQGRTVSSTSDVNDNVSTNIEDDDDILRAMEASLETHREEEAKRNGIKLHVADSDDDSFDD
ncbi:unnamed protein product [Adineta steineri]|uniref:RBR-type E3 ubiquitin transferase n=1 Tax=Adineta steineri TaxID=433720 RepID=A0A818WBL2_9BILA|nr:unnamed protein product [Adineta steineri]CAF3721959.1 unnamed protein product [Adineta steineri]CAF3850440.1 unnamed protein product [Adineta steineri]